MYEHILKELDTVLQRVQPLFSIATMDIDYWEIIFIKTKQTEKDRDYFFVLS